MKILRSLTLTAALITHNLFSQCPLPSAIDTLNINEVSALILNGGDLHWDLANAGSGYEVPKGSGKHSLFASALWMCGIDLGGQLHTAAMTYRQSGYDFWPGPLDTTTASTNPSVAAIYNKIWKLSRYKIEEFKYEWNLNNVQNGTYKPDTMILTWPANGSGGYYYKLAPFVDVNNNGTYDPLIGGDYPIIKGDQMLYWIMNDKCDIYSATGGEPFGVEIHGSAYEYTCPSITDSLKELNYTTFYQYKIFNRSTFQYENVHLGIWQDADLGCYFDDLVGCIQNQNFGFVYNGSPIDPVNCNGYGASPPILSTVILDGPIADANDGIDNNNNGTYDEPGEKNLMTSFVYYDNVNGMPNGNPSGPMHYCNFLNGVWGDGSPMIDCNGDTTQFNFQGAPYDTNSCAQTNVSSVPSDRRFVMGCGPFSLQPGGEVNFEYAVIFSRDTNLIWGTTSYFQQAEKDVATIQKWYAANNFPSCLLLNLGTNEIKGASIISITPNPSSDFIIISYKSQTKNPQFEILDGMGRTVSFSAMHGEENRLNISSLPAGLYLLKIMDGNSTASKHFIKN